MFIVNKPRLSTVKLCIAHFCEFGVTYIKVFPTIIPPIFKILVLKIEHRLLDRHLHMCKINQTFLSKSRRKFFAWYF